MRKVDSGLALYRATVALLRNEQLTARDGHNLLAQAGRNDLKELLSGTYTPKQTRGAFARGPSPALRTPTGRRRQLTKRQKEIRGLKGVIPLNPINMQSRRLVQGVKIRRKSSVAALQELDLTIENVEYAKYVLAVGGTRKMVARQVQAELKRRFGPRNKAYVDRFVRQARP